MTTASSKTPRHLARALPVVAALLAPGLARGQTPATEAQVESARSLYHDARELHQQGKLKEAIALSLEAYRTAPTPVTARQAGRWLIEAGRLIEARDIMNGVAAMPVSPRESDKGRDARQEAAALAIELDARIPKVAITARPNGVDVLLDGHAFLNRDGAAWQGVDPGAHVFTVRAAEKTCATINVTLAEHQAKTIDLHDAAPACRASDAIVSSVPSPLPNRPQERDISLAVESGDRRHRITAAQWSGVAIASAGAIAVGIGSYVALRAKSDYDGVASQCPPRGCTQAAFDERHDAGARADVASVVIGVGAAAIASGLVLWIFGRAKDDGAALGPRVAIGPTGIALFVRTP